MPDIHEENQESEMDQEPDFKKLAIATFIGILVLGGGIYFAYRSTLTKSNLSENINGSPLPVSTSSSPNPPTAPLRFTIPTDTKWYTVKGKIYPYEFSVPSSLPLVIFPGDQTDSIAISWGNIPPQENVLLNIELINKRDPKYLNLFKSDYVQNWYKFFSGLKGVKNVEPFTNKNGLKGYKATYINLAGDSPNLDVFFEVPDKPDIMIHLANGILDPALFDRIVDSVSWNKK